MDLINEKDRVFGGEKSPTLFGLFYHLPYILYPTAYGAKRIKWSSAFLGNDVGQGGLSRSRRPPEDQGWQDSLFDLMGKGSLLTHQMVLTDIFFQGFGAYPFRKWFVHGTKVI